MLKNYLIIDKKILPSYYEKVVEARALLESGNRTAAGPTVPPGGLYLTRLWYEDERLNG